MADFQGTILTQQGKNLLAKALTGVNLDFTKVSLGDGVWDSSINPEQLTNLVSPKVNLPIQDLVIQGDGTAKLRVVLTNTGLTQGFFTRELGIFANDPDLGEILYAVAYANNPDFIPSDGVVKIEDVLDIYTVVSTAQNVTAVISDTVVLATKEDVNNAITSHNTDTTAHTDIRDSVNFAKLNGINFKNFIINGDFQIWQRGTSFTSSGYTADRWRYDTDTDDTATISQIKTNINSEPFEAENYVKISLVAGTTGTYNKFSTRLENPKKFAGKKVTLSFWAIASSQVNINVKTAFNFSGTEYNTASSTVSIGSTWKKYSITFTLGIPAGFSESSNDYLDVAFLLPINTTVDIYFANVQLEEGDTATDFEHIPYDVQLMRCQRYFQKWQLHYTSYNLSINSAFTVYLLTPMRTLPTITVTTATNDTGETGIVSIDYVANHSFRVWDNAWSAKSDGYFHFQGTADAEL